ncbi:hypothetical protein EON82_00955 [bacterium]|nr:MAG: hypothetical protein EON82_00955 [bacterium]
MEKARLVAFGVIASLLLALYLTRPDWAQAAHWWPMLFCTPLVVLPFLTLRPKQTWSQFLGAMLAWCLALHVVREPSALVLLLPNQKEGDTLRVVSLNCAGGTTEAAAEAFAQDADVVLLQEVGSRTDFVHAAEKSGYPYVSYSVDDAVFTRHPLTNPSKATDYAAATIELDGKRVRLVALRLLPPVFRLDLWSPDCWRNYAEDAAQRRKRLSELFTEAGASGICIVGGDFNATNPRLVSDNRPDWSEAGRSVGRGWRGTGTNDFPFVWVDQIWGSPEIRWSQAYVRKTRNSDHRMVVGDFRL